MSQQEEFNNFVKKVKENESLQQKMADAKTYTDLVALAKENGYEIAEATLMEKLEDPAEELSEELSDEELEDVAGGGYRWRGPMRSLVSRWHFKSHGLPSAGVKGGSGAAHSWNGCLTLHC